MTAQSPEGPEQPDDPGPDAWTRKGQAAYDEEFAAILRSVGWSGPEGAHESAGSSREQERTQPPTEPSAIAADSPTPPAPITPPATGASAPGEEQASIERGLREIDDYFERETHYHPPDLRLGSSLKPPEHTDATYWGMIIGLVGGLICAIVTLLPTPIGSGSGPLAVLLLVVGLVCFFLRLPRHTERDHDDDGSRV